VQRYLITDRKLCGGVAALLKMLEAQMELGTEYVQIREKDLSARELFSLTQAVVAARGKRTTRILVNTRADIAAAAGADGVHLPANAARVNLPGLLVGRSCHTLADVRAAGADYVTFGPVFHSPGKGTPIGVDQLREACRLCVPVFALGGITWGNATECIEAGAAGIAGIRLFLYRPDAPTV
jgi:thiamine-phosphate pyrophosphorylase